MSQKSPNKRPSKTTGVKALIATASVAATIAGWALLPSNDPQAAASATGQSGQQSALSVPGTVDNGPIDTLPQIPSIEQPTPVPQGDQLPQVQAPQSFSQWPMPFTNSHSSR